MLNKPCDALHRGKKTWLEWALAGFAEHHLHFDVCVSWYVGVKRSPRKKCAKCISSGNFPRCCSSKLLKVVELFTFNNDGVELSSSVN